jgi:hypothetical protein
MKCASCCESFGPDREPVGICEITDEILCEDCAEELQQCACGRIIHRIITCKCEEAITDE